MAIGGLHDCRASFDKLRMRGIFGGRKKEPHLELVEGRTLPIPISCKRDCGITTIAREKQFRRAAL